nr:putative zinc finger, CCHC-type [Tanacetum cinerariifolium]
LYCRGKDNGVNILKSIDKGPYKLGTFRETLAASTEGTPQFDPKRPRVYSDLNSEEQDQYNVDIWATNILLQGLPKDIYTLINHYTDAKDIWDNVKMLLEGSELTKEDRESQLYDEFEHFRQHTEESINDYYVRFSKLINDMRNIKMTMPKLQLNSKFVNNMLPECGRFVMAVKLNRGLRESNYDQLFAYLKQHEAHAKENKMVLERLSQPIAQPTADPLALLSNVSNTQHGLPSSSTSSITPLTPPRGPENAFDDDVDEQPIQDLALNVDNVFQAEDCDAFDSDVDEAPTAQTMFMANLSSADPITDEAGPSYDSDILSEVQDHDQYLDDTCAYQEEHVMQDSVQLDHVVDLHADHTSISNMILYDQYVKDNDVSVVHSNASSVPNDTFMMIYDDMCEPIAPSVSSSSRNAVVKNSLTAELATYREQVELNNRDAHLDYLRHLKESVETIREIVEEAKVVRPLDRSIVSAYRYTQYSQELLEYAIGTCPQGSQKRAKKLAHTPLIRKKQVTSTKPSDRQDSNKNKHVVSQKIQKTNVPVPHSTRVKRCLKAGGFQ